MMIIEDRKVQAALFMCLCILVVSLFYRFYELDKRSYFPCTDAPDYAGLVTTYREAFDYIVKTKILKQDIGSMNDYLYEKGMQFGTAAKDSLIPIGLIGSIIFGNNANTILYTSAIFGVFTIILLFYILSRSINLVHSFLLTLLFAVSPYHIGFSREGNPVTFSSFFLLTGIYLYNRFLESNNLKYLSFSGLTLGFSFLSHYNIAPFIFVFFAYEVYYLLWKRSDAKRIVVISAFAFLPLLLMDICTRAIKLYGTWQHIKMIDKFYPYFNILFKQLKENMIAESSIHEGPLYYFNSLFYYEGIIPSTLLIIATLLIIRKGLKVDSGIGYFLIFIFLLPFNYYLWLQPNVTDRAMLSFIPIWYFMIGYGLSAFRYKKVLTLLIIIAIFSNGIRSLDYFNYRSNFQQAVNYMERNKGIKHITSVLNISRLYVGRKNAVNHAEPPYSQRLTAPRNVIYQINPISFNKIKSLYNNGYNYLVLNIPPSVSNELTEVAMNIQPEYSTDVMICNDRGDGYDPALLRDKKGKYLYRFNVYDLGNVLKSYETKYKK